VILTGWIRLPESKAQDDNSDIFDYMGTGEIHFQKFSGIHTYEIIMPLAIKPGAELRYSYPWQDNLRWFFNLRFGYGHSLIEYDQKITRVGMGITLEIFLDQK
jgi:phospholipase A1